MGGNTQSTCYVDCNSQRGRLTAAKKIPLLFLFPMVHDRFCAYCIVPLARGREISRTVLDIVSDVKKAVEDGAPQEYFHFSKAEYRQEKLVAKEIWLLGQTVNSYKNGSVKFHDLLRLINDIPGDF